MKRIFIVKTMVVFSFWSNSAAQTPRSIEGVYELLRYETVVTQMGPNKIEPASITVVTPPEWTGVCIMKDGHYSFFRMRADRKVPLDYNRELGFDASAGTFRVTRNRILFVESFAINPMYKNRKFSVNYTLRNGILTFDIPLIAMGEELRHGTIRLVFRKKLSTAGGRD